MKPFFINEAFTKAVNDYMGSKEKSEGILYNSFLVVVIRILVLIYGEIDIINPFQINNEDALDTNLERFGAKKEEIANLKRMIDGYAKIELRNKTAIKREINPYFIAIQKQLIDLFNLKRLNFGVSDEEQKNFFDLLFTPGTSNALRLSTNFLEAENPYEIAEYFKNAMAIKVEEKKKEEKDLLGFDVYKMFNVSIADISKMNKEDVDNLNRQIYESFDIKENALNKDYLLNEKIKRMKIERNPITTGNGYVDILLIMSIIITTIMVVSIFGMLIFK